MVLILPIHCCFGTFNGLPKINKSVIRAWAGILQRVPGSRLVVKNGSLKDTGTCEYLMSRFREEGIDPDRVELFGLVNTTAEHLAFYSRLDIALDTFPYNGVTTTCEALWMGVPVITLTGRIAACRYGESLLNQVGLPGFVADSVESYIQLAVDLAGDRSLRNSLRTELRSRMLNSPLCDEQGFVSRIEATYRQVWRKWCKRHAR